MSRKITPFNCFGGCYLFEIASGTRTFVLVPDAIFVKKLQFNHNYNNNSLNFFNTNFNDMKRMNFIRIALFAVLTFMGTISLSAQNWVPPATAIVGINGALDQLHVLPVAPTKATPTNINTPAVMQNAMVGECSNCTLTSVKIAFLEQVMLKVKQGGDVGVSVDEVNAMFIGGANNEPSLLNAINTSYIFVVDLLS